MARNFREKIAQKEAEVDSVVLQARRESEGRVKAASERCDAEDELEEALLELSALKERGRASAESSSKIIPMLKQDINTRRLEVLAASPPFILALEQALVTVVSVEKAASLGAVAKRTRWRSTLKRLMGDASDSIDHFKELPGREKNKKEVDSELTLVAACACCLSLHVNAWTTAQLLRELERIWLQAVQAEAKADPQYQLVVAEWETACETLATVVSKTREASVGGEAELDAVGARVRDCQLRAGIGPKAEKAGWWKQRQRRFLSDELRHIESKVASFASPSNLAARYNLLLARCAEAGAWTTALSVYRSTISQGVVPKSARKKREAGGPFSLEPFVYRNLLRAAKNASPPQPGAAMLVLREMRRRGEEPTATHYNLVVCACARAAAFAASTSALLPLDAGDAEQGSAGRRGSVDQFVARDVDEAKSSRVERGLAQQGINAAGEGRTTVAVDGVPLVSTRLDGSCGEDALPKENPAFGCVDDKDDVCLLSSGGKGMEFRGAESARDAWCLALEVVAEMRKMKVAPTEVTFKTLVECCRCAAAAPLPKPAGDGEVCKGSSPAEIYTELKDAGVPSQFCYQAGFENALKGGRIFPEYVAELQRST